MPSAPPANSSPSAALRKRWLLRALSVLVMAFLFGFGIRQVSAALNQSRGPAGFVRGAVQGALMPCALPNLLVGNDVVIYTARNTGRTYKLGYTVGVNACGAFFFGFFFWRLNRWRRRR